MNNIPFCGDASNGPPQITTPEYCLLFFISVPLPFEPFRFRSLTKQDLLLTRKTENIILKVKTADDLFYESVIPLSCNRVLHPDVEEFIIEEAEKLQRHSKIHITVRVEEHSFNAKEIAGIIHKHFDGKREKEKLQLQKSLRLGWRSLFVGFIFLTVMFLLTKVLVTVLSENALMITLRELFIILGWVALWRPAELLLYEWRPYEHNAKLFERITRCSVEVTTG